MIVACLIQRLRVLHCDALIAEITQDICTSGRTHFRQIIIIKVCHIRNRIPQRINAAGRKAKTVSMAIALRINVVFFGYNWQSARLGVVETHAALFWENANVADLVEPRKGCVVLNGKEDDFILRPVEDFFHMAFIIAFKVGDDYEYDFLPCAYLFFDRMGEELPTFRFRQFSSRDYDEAIA